MSKLFIYSLSSFAALVLLGGGYIVGQSEANYKRCMEVNDNYNYCKVLIYGR